jgi:hypothetical protein
MKNLNPETKKFIEDLLRFLQQAGTQMQAWIDENPETVQQLLAFAAMYKRGEEAKKKYLDENDDPTLN